MKAVDDPDIDRFPEPGPANNPLASWYSPGLSDELGDRLLMFDNSSAPSLELLRFRPALTAHPAFEAALRERVDQLSVFSHPSFSTIRAVEHLGRSDGLALLSNYIPGRRLSEVLQEARGPAFATALIQLLAPALSSLRQQGGTGAGHGSMASNRIIITPEGRLVIVEHALGPALEALRLDPVRLRAEFGVAVPPSRDPYPRLDIRADYFQLGLVALSLLVGRQVRPDVTPDQVAQLLAQVAPNADRESPVLFRRLRVWLERALQLNGEIFRSPSDAQDALNSVADPAAAPRTLQHRPARAIPAHTETSPASAAESRPSIDVVTAAPPAGRDTITPPDPPGHIAIATASEDADRAPIGEASSTPVEREPLAEASAGPASWNGYRDAISDHVMPRVNESMTMLKRSGARLRSSLSTAFEFPAPGLAQSVAAVLALCVIGESLVIATLLNRRAAPATPAVLVETGIPGADVVVDGQPAGTTPLQLTIGKDTHSVRVVDARPPVPTAGLEPEPAAVSPAPAASRSDAVTPPAPQRSGGIRLVSPFEVEVFDGEQRLGSSATGIVSAAAGRRELDLINARLGYRARRVVDVKVGRVTAVELAPPNGLMSINASPWAEVLIDGKPAGETPLANLSVSLGEHEVIFRHPQLGEQRRTALVRVDGVTRVSVTFQ
jgi:hypothetical protein